MWLGRRRTPSLQINEQMNKKILQSGSGWVVQLVECHAMHRKITGSIPCQGTYPGPQWEYTHQRQMINVFLSH